jgi:UDP-N-acetyl-L-fucosamine synthase
MKKLTVVTVVGTRPEIIRLSRVINALDKSPAIEHILIHTGQNYDYELNEIFFEDLGIRKPDYFLGAAGKSSSETIGNIIQAIDLLLGELQPDAFLVLGDTNSCLCSIPAKKRKIPIFHMEAGNRCFDQRVPEETNRKIVDHIADINLTYSDIAREYLLAEGISADRIIKTGSPMYEVLSFYSEKIQVSNVVEKLGLKTGQYFVVSAHREENVSNSENLTRLVESLNLVAETYGLPIIISAHPRTTNELGKRDLVTHELLKFIKPLGFFDYNSLQKNSRAVLSDSGTISEEASILNFRALNIREAHERPEAMEEASVMMVGLSSDRVLQGLAQLALQKSDERTFRQVVDYSMPNVSEKVVRIIISYTSYINSTVWKL